MIELLSTVAPWIATALGGPLRQLALNAASEALGLTEKTDKALNKACSNLSVEQIRSMKLADQEFSLKLQQLGFENHQQLIGSMLNDRDAARKREVSLRDKTPRNLAYILIGGSMAIGGLLLFGELKLDSTLAGVVLGYLFNESGAASAYYFGERRRSQD
ncbi:hypothetical protein ACSVCE_00555 [Chromobacterium haemolyticum]|uniref:hypothetical protein n=1 Tax=Chromobacterium haemolyticum TaxID=394935 RepID=UPI00405568DB